MARHSLNIEANAPYMLYLGADGRADPIDYADDQVWQVALGEGGLPALGLSTSLGRRAGLISVQPMWWVAGLPVYEFGHYALKPRVTAFMPGFIQVEAGLAPGLLLAAAYYALDSHTMGIRFAIKGSGAPQVVRLDLVAFAAAGGAERQIVPMRGTEWSGSPVLWFGTFGDVDPVVALLDGDNGDSPNKLSLSKTVASGATVEWRAVVSAVQGSKAGRIRATELLKTVWRKPPTHGKLVPHIETDNADIDAMLAMSYAAVMHGVVNVAQSRFPAATVVPRRTPDAGYRPFARPGGSSGIRVAGEPGARPVTGDEMAPHEAYTVALALAPVLPAQAQGVVLNYLSVQRPDGWIDWSPGPMGERRGWLCLPLLARLTWSVFQYTEDIEFLRAAYPGLVRFFERWFRPDLDSDGAGFPHWQHEGQAAYPFLPIFSRGLPHGQNADLRYIDSPDLPTYLLSEAICLREIAAQIGLEAPPNLGERIARIKAQLGQLWNPGLNRFTHRDKMVDTIAPSRALIEARPANERIVIDAIEPTSRLIVEIVGGTSRANNLKVSITGVGHNGLATSEVAGSEAFAWTAGRGVYTTRSAYRKIASLVVEGVIPNYKVMLRTVSTWYLDITAVMPLWAVEIEPDQAKATQVLLKDAAHFWRPCGVIMASAQDEAVAEGKHEFAKAVWNFWNTMMGEALIEMGDLEGAAELVRRMLNGMRPVVQQEKAFYEGYHSEKPGGLGKRGHVSGVAPLHLFMRVIGVRIISAARVWVGGPYVWRGPVTVTHHGVSVTRSATETRVAFPDGQVIELAPDVPWTLITPPVAG